MSEKQKNQENKDAVPRVRLHHTGFVVESIEASVQGFARSLGATWNGVVFHDPQQKVKVTFLTTGPSDAQVELVEAAAEDAPVLSFLKKGGGLHHLCYEVSDLEKHLQYLRRQKAIVVKAPVPAVAFENRRIAWVVTKERLLLELLEERRS